MCGVIGIFVIAGLLGIIVTELFHRGLFTWLRLQKRFCDPRPNDDPETKPLPPWFMGAVERLAFSSLVVARIDGRDAHRNVRVARPQDGNQLDRSRDGGDRAELAKVIRQSQVALLAGVVSLMFAIWGGLVARGEWWPCSNGLLPLRIPSTVVPSEEAGHANQS